MAKSDNPGARPYGSGARDGNSADSIQHQAERLARSLGESAQQVWLAGLGALGRAQHEGGRMFESLVQEGTRMQDSTREFADRQTEAARSNVEQARDRTSESWNRLERAFEERVQRTLSRLGVPVRDDLAELSRRIDALTSELRRSNAGTGPAASARPVRPAARKATHTSPHASPVKKATVKKAPVRKTTRRSNPTPGL